MFFGAFLTRPTHSFLRTELLLGRNLSRISQHINFPRGGSIADSPVSKRQKATAADGAGEQECAAAATPLKLALCQIRVGADKEANIATARKAVEDAAEAGASLVSLPECWNSPYDTLCFPKYAEPVPEPGQAVDAGASPSVAMLVDVARQCGVYLIGGSVPEKDDNGVYNTCVVVGPDGQLLAKHRKVHLFDINVPGKISFKESDTLTGGDKPTVIDTPWGKVGVGICYDIRFPELSGLMRQAGCRLLVFPGAFNLVTGPAHWELLARARAVDNQVYVALASPARSSSPEGYQAWGHSSVVSPWGDVLATCDHLPTRVEATLDMDKVDEVRRNIPVSMQKRNDIYELKDVREK